MSSLEQRLVQLLCKGPVSKYFRPGSHMVSVSIAQQCCCSTNTAIDDCANKWTWLCSNAILFTQIGHGARLSLQDAVCRLQL